MCEYSIPDEQLRAAARQARSAMLSALPEPSECTPDFSPGFTQSMEALIHKAKRKAKARIIRRFIAAVLVLVVVGSGIWLTADAKAYAEFQKWVRSIYENTVIYRFFADADRTSLPEYTFGWLPDGYEEKEETQLQTSLLLLAQNENGDLIYLYCQLVADKNQVISYGENLSVEKAEVNGICAEFYPDHDNPSDNTLFWIDDNVTFSLTAQLEKNIMVQIAENIQKK